MRENWPLTPAFRLSPPQKRRFGLVLAQSWSWAAICSCYMQTRPFRSGQECPFGRGWGSLFGWRIDDGGDAGEGAAVGVDRHHPATERGCQHLHEGIALGRVGGEELGAMAGR